MPSESSNPAPVTPQAASADGVAAPPPPTSPPASPAAPRPSAPKPGKSPAPSLKQAQQDPVLVRWGLIGLTYFVVAILIVIPVINVFAIALSEGVGAYWKSLTADPDTRHAIFLTLTVAPLAVILNTIFGVAAAWVLTKFRFPGRTFLTSFIDLPFAISPVVAGLMFMLLFGMQGYLGPWLRDHGIRLAFAWPGLVLVTAFVTLPFVARELIPIMEAIGPDEEIAAVSLGANGWQTFWRVTVPNIKWGLLFGIILCNARAMGEFGAVHVVSGHISGKTDTIPLRVEKLFQEYKLPASYALASVLTTLSIVTLLLRIWLEHKTKKQVQDAKAEHAATAHT